MTFSRNGSTSSGPSGPPKETSSRASYGARRRTLTGERSSRVGHPVRARTVGPRPVPCRACSPPYRDLLVHPGRHGVLRRRRSWPGCRSRWSAWASCCWSWPRRDRYGLAGAVSATFALVNAVAAPADRPARRPARPAPGAGARGRALRRLPGALRRAGDGRDAPTWTLVRDRARPPALFAPSIGSLVRARWGYVLGPEPAARGPPTPTSRCSTS